MNGYKQLNITSWFLLSFLLLLLISCQPVGGDVFRPVSESTSTLLTPTPDDLIATPTLRSRPAAESTEPDALHPLPTSPDVQPVQPQVNISRSVLLENRDGELDHLKGIGRIVGLTTCTASLIETSQEPDAPAYILTAGRCVQPRLANAVFINGLVGEMSIIFNLFTNTQDEQIDVQAKSVTYSTMKGHDLAIVELVDTLGALKERGIEPLPLSDEIIEEPLSILMIGAPAIGFSSINSFLRMETCILDGQVNLVESKLFTYDAYRTDCRDNFSGSAGSPLFADGNDALLGINSATTVAGFHPCSMGAPCEVTEQSTVMHENKSYAVPLGGLVACFNQEGRFDISLEDCHLDDGHQLQLSNSLGEVTQSMELTADGVESSTLWDTSVTGEYLYYRYKSGLISNTNCRDEVGYSEAYLLYDGVVIKRQVSLEEGINVLCVLGGNSPSPSDEDQWQSPEFAAAVLVRVDNTPPEMDPIVVLVHEEEYFSVYFHTSPPELNYYEYKVGSSNEIKCHDIVNYNLEPREPLQIPKDQTQYKLCVIGIDAAGNRAQPYEIILDDEQNAAR